MAAHRGRDGAGLAAPSAASKGDSQVVTPVSGVVVVGAPGAQGLVCVSHTDSPTPRGAASCGAMWPEAAFYARVHGPGASSTCSRRKET